MIDARLFAGSDPRVQIRPDLRRIEHGLLVQTPIPYASPHRFLLRWITTARVKNRSFIKDLDLFFRLELKPLEALCRDARISKHMNLLSIKMIILVRLGHRLEVLCQ